MRLTSRSEAGVEGLVPLGTPPAGLVRLDTPKGSPDGGCVPFQPPKSWATPSAPALKKPPKKK